MLVIELSTKALVFFYMTAVYISPFIDTCFNSLDYMTQWSSRSTKDNAF